MEHANGISTKAAKLFSIAAEIKNAVDDWNRLRKTGHEKRGGDTWVERGKGGAWHREHTTPRVSLFTPYKVAGGPAAKIPLNNIRFTCGVTQSGKSFEFHDDWTLPDRKHYVLEEPWVGYTVFVERKANLANVQDNRFSDLTMSSLFDKSKAWADRFDEDEDAENGSKATKRR